jgi:hypothetical protein
MEAILEKPSLRDQQVASASLFSFTKAIAEEGPERNGVRIRLSESRTDITIPRKALELLQFILSSMAQGKAVSLIPSDAEVTTQQAADMLNVSRPHVVKLLEQGTIPFKKDLLAYESAQKANREHQLQLLAEQTQELHLGYE